MRHTAPRRFLATVEAHPRLVALRSMKGHALGGWDEWTFSEYASKVATVAAGLRHYGVEPGNAVLLMMRNRPDFHWFDTACQFLRATPVSIYNSSSPEEVRYLAHHAEAHIAILENDTFLDKFSKVRADLPHVQRVFVIEPLAAAADDVLPAEDSMAHGSLDLAAAAATTEPSDLATLIYTSGTPDRPKA